MPRKSAAKAEEPSSEDVSAHSDVEMQDQQEDKMNGFKKFGVSTVYPRAFYAAPKSVVRKEQRSHPT